jgi:hypothetical protein
MGLLEWLEQYSQYKSHETVLCNSIGMMQRVTLLFFLLIRVQLKVSNFAVSLVNQASCEAGGPDNIAVSIEKPTIETSKEMSPSGHFAHSGNGRTGSCDDSSFVR